MVVLVVLWAADALHDVAGAIEIVDCRTLSATRGLQPVDLSADILVGTALFYQRPYQGVVVVDQTKTIVRAE